MKRYAGVLLPVTSLPSKYGIGCFDQAAYDFVDWLQKAGQRYWQILPLGATSYGLSDDSPYQAYSAFAGNPYLISLDALVEEGVLTREECDGVSFGDNPAKVDFDKLHEHRFALLHKAYERSGISANPDYQNFIRDNGWWLNDYALFMALKTFFHDQPFRAWPEDIRMHWGFALEHYNRELYFDIEFQKYMQFKFNQQWSRLKAYANGKHIQIVGDIPIYVSPDGADVYTPSGDCRTTDENYNMIRVGEEIASVLTSMGLTVLHDKELYDYPNYSGAYNRSLAAIEKYRAEYPSLLYILDVHRDAVADSEGNNYKLLCAEEPGAAQLEFVIGSSGGGLEHPDWRENLKLACAVQETLYAKYPTLMRPVTVRNSRYNQQVTTGSLLIEVGTAGNSLDEALAAARLFAAGFAETVLA